MPKNHDFALDTWLNGLKLSDEDRTLLKTKLSTDDNLTYISESQMRLNDYTSKIQDVARKDKAADDYIASLETWKADQEKLYGSNTTEAARLAGENAALKKYLTDNGYDPTTLGLGNNPPPPDPPKPDAPTFDTSKVLTRDQGLALAKWPIIFRNLDARYTALFGKPMTEAQADEFLGKVMTDTREPVVLFDEHFNVPARRVELDNQERETWRANTRKEIENQVRSEILSQRHVPTGPFGTAPVIETFGAKGQSNADNQWRTDAANDYAARVSARESGERVN